MPARVVNDYPGRLANAHVTRQRTPFFKVSDGFPLLGDWIQWWQPFSASIHAPDVRTSAISTVWHGFLKHVSVMTKTVRVA
ncbi:MAG: hypothetical protein OXE92_11390 [Bacteroidetes bacterium]|nr:hypothetical protein [Bacteroidota bacterium]MCY4206315.1 hypothetical protein [Bacteroidota bacterium]